MTNLILTTEYFGPISSFRYKTESNRLYVEKHETYQKKSYRNRCLINSPQGKHLLSVPLMKGKNAKTYITDVEIAYHEDWVMDHIRAMQTGYNNTPFFEYYIDEIRNILLQHHKRLVDLNDTILKYLIKTLGIDDILIMDTEGYYKEYKEDYNDLRRLDYQKKNRNKPSLISYRQPFDDKFAFIDELSILDLLFCVGPESVLYLENNR